MVVKLYMYQMKGDRLAKRVYKYFTYFNNYYSPCHLLIQSRIVAICWLLELFHKRAGSRYYFLNFVYLICFSILSTRL